MASAGLHRMRPCNVRTAFNDFAELREGACVDAVGLRQLSHRLCKISCLSGIDDRYRVTRSLQYSGGSCFRATRGFHRNQCDLM
jgi:hypothetical protein